MPLTTLHEGEFYTVKRGRSKGETGRAVDSHSMYLHSRGECISWFGCLQDLRKATPLEELKWWRREDELS